MDSPTDRPDANERPAMDGSRGGSPAKKPRKSNRVPGEHERMLELGRAVSDERAVDWDAASSGTPRLNPAIRALRQLEALGRAHRRLTASDLREPASSSRTVLFEWGPLEVLESVGQGAFGEVYRAFDTRLRREVALKLGRSDQMKSESSARRFLEEARRLARIRHPNVLVVHGVDVHGERVGFWTDFIRGETLAAHLTSRGLLGSADAVAIGVVLCRALHSVHAAGFVHGDVKATNVMREEGGRIVLRDFGASSWQPEPATPLFGTPLVLAPELLLGHPAEPASDLYSLGVLLYHLTTGRYPVEADTLIELRQKHERRESLSLRDRRDDLPLEFTRIVDRAVSFDSPIRYGNARDLERDFFVSGLVRRDLLARAERNPAGYQDEVQTLQSLLDEIGPLPEELCRRIGREAARSLARIHDSGSALGETSLTRMLFRMDGSVELIPSNLPNSAPVSESVEQSDLRALGTALLELMRGAKPSPFFEAVAQQLLAGGSDSPFATARDLLRILTEGEKGSWWRDRARAMRRASRRPLPRMIVPRETALHGREEDLAHLEAAFGRAKSGDGCVVLIEGEAGIGKSRLVDGFVARLQQAGEDINFLFGTYPPDEGAMAADAFLAAYRQHIGEERLEETLEDYLSSAPRLIQPFAALLLGQSTSPDGTALTTDSLQTAFIRVAQSLAAERPTIVLIDDLHFAPEEGRRLFSSLAFAVPGHRLLLLSGMRALQPVTWAAEIERQEHCTRLSLQRLSASDVAGVLTEALASDHLAEELAPELTKRSAGNPLFLFEYLHSLQQAEVVRRDPHGRWFIADSLQQAATPPTIRHLIQARLATLAEPDHEILEIASCCGFEFDPALVGEAAGVGALPGLKRFAVIERRYRLIHATGHNCVFDHHQVRESLYESLPAPLRERYHAALAAVLEEREHAFDRDAKELDGSVVVRITEHHLRSGDGRAGLRYLEAALDHLGGTYQNEGAVRLADLALSPSGLLEGIERFNVLVRKARRLALLGWRDQEHATLLELMESGDKIGAARSSARARCLLGDRYVRDSRNEEARQLLDEALRLARECGDLLEQATALATLGRLHYGTARYDEALEAYASALALTVQSGDRMQEVTATGNMGAALLAQGRTAEARSYFERSLALSRELGHSFGEAAAIGHLGVIHSHLGEQEEGRRVFAQHRELTRKLGYRQGEAVATLNQAATCAYLGRCEEAIAHSNRALCLLREVGFRVGEIAATWILGQTLLLAGDYEAAQTAFEGALRICREIEHPKGEGDARLGLSSIAQALGDPATAEHGYREVLTLRRRLNDREGEAIVLLALSVLRKEMGVPDEADSLLVAARDLSAEVGPFGVLVAATAHRAIDHLEERESALELFKTHAPRLGHVDRMEILYLLWRATGNRTHLEESAGLLNELRAWSPAAYREPMLVRVPLYRDIRAAVATTSS